MAMEVKKMYRIKESKKEEIKEYRTNYYVEKTGLTQPYVSGIVNGTQKCTEIIAKALLSVKFDISFYDTRLNELVKKYFEEE